MKATLVSLALAVLLGVAVVPVSAADAARQEAEQTLGLKDGSTLYVFKDGKMAREDKYGRAVRLEAGDVLETVDGKKIKVSGNEVGRLDLLLKRGHGN